MLHIEESGEQYEITIDRHKHRTFNEFNNYISRELKIKDPNAFKFTQEDPP